MFYTFLKNPAAETLLGHSLELMAREIGKMPECSGVRAVVLGGGYGRGEGGATPEGALCNDLDFFVIPHDGISADSLQSAFRHLGRKWKEILSIDVDFFIVPAFQWLIRNEKTLMVQELLAGNRIIYGDSSVLSGVPRLQWRELPWREGARLLLNRGTGLLLSRRRMQNPEEKEFIRRNLHKAALGCGDALLIAHHAYRKTGMERLDSLRDTGVSEELSSFYKTALRYKYSPFMPEAEDLPERLHDMTTLWNASVCVFSHTVTGCNNANTADAVSALLHCRKENSGSFLRNTLLSLRYPGSKLLPLREHPRLKLLGSLAAVLNTPVRQAEDRYLKLWRRFN